MERTKLKHRKDNSNKQPLWARGERDQCWRTAHSNGNKKTTTKKKTKNGMGGWVREAVFKGQRAGREDMVWRVVTRKIEEGKKGGRTVYTFVTCCMREEEGRKKNTKRGLLFTPLWFPSLVQGISARRSSIALHNWATIESTIHYPISGIQS